MGAIYLYDWYSRYVPSHLYEGTISASKIGIIPILKSIRRTAQATALQKAATSAATCIVRWVCGLGRLVLRLRLDPLHEGFVCQSESGTLGSWQRAHQDGHQFCTL